MAGRVPGLGLGGTEGRGETEERGGGGREGT